MPVAIIFVTVDCNTTALTDERNDIRKVVDLLLMSLRCSHHRHDLVMSPCCFVAKFDEITILYMQVPVGHPGEIEEIFDTISYNKGASIIRMLHQYVGDQVSLYERYLALARD